MNYTELGLTGLRVSKLGLGGIPIQRTTQDKVTQVLKYLCDEGVNFIDTARAYTVSEGYIGNALEALGARDKFIIATKSMARTKEAMEKDINESLRLLKTDYIDLYQLHNVRFDADFDAIFCESGAITALKEAVKQGKIKHIGASAHTERAFRRLLEYDEIETIMFPFNIVEQQGIEAMKIARQRGVGFIAMKPLAGGSITNGRLAVKYILQNPLCHIVIPGMADTDEACQNLLGACDTAAFTQDELLEIDKIKAKLSGDFCRRCGYCAPCTAGIDIPSLFILEGYLNRYDLAEWAKARYEGTAIKADACIGCKKCEERCPYSLPIVKKLAAVHDMLK